MDTKKTDSIAVIGLSCWYPGARSPRQLWENVLSRRRQFRRIPDVRLPLSEYYDPDPSVPDKTYGRLAGVIDGFEFDWSSRRIPRSTYEATDIAHWLALEVALQAVGDAGYTRETIPGDRTGVIVGNSLTGEQTRSNVLRTRWPFVRRALRAALTERGRSARQIAEVEAWLEAYYKSVFPPVGSDSLAGGLSNTIAGRICNFLDLHGGGYTVDGACSSSLLAVATAANGLVHGDLDLALAGGVDISLDTFELIGFSKTMALTRTDMTVYDRRGSGFIPGEGCAFVVLKRLEDAERDGDHIYAVLRGWGISSDGGGTGLTAPSPSGQAMALKRAYARAGYSMDSLSFIEGHGTGTRAGDKAELEGIAIAIGEESNAPDRFCGVTSLKSVIGHAKAAAGIGGFVKAVMAVNRRVIPPTANCKTPHPAFDDVARKLYPVLQGTVLDPDSVVRAGVSGMGFGGINCHVTVESGGPPSDRLEPSVEERALMVSQQDTELFALSGEDLQALTRSVDRLKDRCQGIAMGEMVDLAAATNREVEAGAPLRCAVVAGKPDELEERLEALSELLDQTDLTRETVVHDRARTVWAGMSRNAPRVGMLFPGQGSQKLNMARVLVERHPWARALVEEADACAREVGGEPPSRLIYKAMDRAAGPEEVDGWFRVLSQTENAQPAICLSSAIWHTFLSHLGVTPAAVGGHSLGELTAFHAAGAFDFRTLMRLAAIRGRAMAAPSDEAGTMVSLFCSQERAQEIVDQVSGYVVLANINGPRQTVLSGEKEAIDEAVRVAAKTGIQTRRLKVSNAFHSRLMEEAARLLSNAQVLPETFDQLTTRLFSSLDGKPVSPGLPLRRHFSNQVLARVDFVSLSRSFIDTCDVVLEVGTGRVLSGMFEAIAGDDGPACLPVESAPENDQDLNVALAALFTRGASIEWSALYDRRLVRTFVPASERVFVENPCERPFKVPDRVEVTGKAEAPAALLDLVPEGVDLTAEELDAYLEARRGFIADVIRADIRHLSSTTGLPSTQVIDAAWTEGEAEAAGEPAESEESPPEAGGALTREAIERVIVEEVETLTGFPRDSFDMEARLLDGLNMDSLRTGEFVANVARRLQLDGVDTFAFVNNTLAEAADRFEQLLKEQSPERFAGEGGAEPTGAEQTSSEGPPDVLAVVMEEASRVSGYPLETLDSAAVVEKDLGLGPDLLKQLLNACSTRLGTDIHVDLEPLAQRSLAQLASILERMVATQAAGRPTLEVARPTWVREFEPELVVEPRPPLPAWWGQRQEDDWKTSRILLLHNGAGSDHAEALQNGLLRRGAQVQLATYEEASERNLASDPGFSHLIAVLPQTRDEARGPGQLREMVARLASVAAPPPASEAPRRRTTVAYVQFGGGYFGTRPEFAYVHRVGAQALAASLHLERTDLRVRVIDLSPTLDPERAAEAVIEEINTPAPYAAAGYDFELTRRVLKPRLLQPVRYRPRPVKLGEEDVIVVSGGGRGITAACALGLARATRARCALLGRSPHPKDAPNRASSQEILETLDRFQSHGLNAAYYACDVEDLEAVRSVIARIQADLGPVTAVVHGAGLNRPRPAAQVSVDAALEEIGPKVIGAMNLMASVDTDRLKLFAGLTSIIGITGMPGNAWYGFSNEVLDVLLRRFGADHPDTTTVSVAFSIWKETGLGVKLGSVEKLQKIGIEAIETRDGVERFVHLCLQDPGCHQVIVTARVGGLDTWNLDYPTPPEDARYLETLVRATPAVEAVFQTHLELETDPYLEHHRFEGAYLLPTVFGLEAMAQAAAYVAGRWDLSRVVIENVVLRRPITVDPTSGSDIVIQAEALELAQEDGPLTIRANVTPATAHGMDPAFAATFVLDPAVAPDSRPIERPEQPLPIEPVFDLYRENLLFQGPMFQRLSCIWSIDAEEEVGREAVFDVHRLSDVQAAATAFPGRPARLLLGDPFYRDALLQSALILVPRQNSLPSYVARWEIFPCQTTAFPTTATARVTLQRIEGREIDNEVIAADADDRLLERLVTYRLSILRPREDAPGAADLIAPDALDTRTVSRAWRSICNALDLEPPTILLRYLDNLHKVPTPERHRIERPFMEEVVATAAERMGAGGEAFSIAWEPDGKPVVRGLERIRMAISVSHDDRLCMFVAGPFAQGCDVTPVMARDRAEWSALFGGRHDTTLDALLEAGDDLDRAGARLWTALEILRKLDLDTTRRLEVARRTGEAVLFVHHGPGRSTQILTLPVHLTWGPPRMLGTAVEDAEEITTEFSLAATQAYEPLTTPRAELLQDAGPQGQPVMVERFHVTFKPCAQLSRHLHYSTLLYWAGEVREMSAWPVHEQLARDLATGKVGLVTNWAVIKYFGEAVTHDVVEARMWTIKNGGPTNSTMDLAFDFRKCLPDGSHQRLAWMVQQTTWVKVLEHGMVEPDEYPDYYWQLMKEMMPRWEGETEREPLPEPLAPLHDALEADEQIFRAPEGAHAFPVLHEYQVETSQGHANFVGNIYFAHYHAWMGEARDRFFYKLIPGRFQGVGEAGELLVLECRVDHLREAMPFDVLAVTAGIKILRRSSARMAFEFFRIEPDGTRTYLAHGAQELAWITRDDRGNPVPTPWPDEVMDAFQKVL